MHLKEYISEILKNPPVEFDDITEEFLNSVSRGHTSAYKIFRHLNKTHFKIAYKNVHRRLQILHKNGLIEEVSAMGGYKHGARNFRVATRGLIFLMSEPISPSLTRYDLEHSDNIIFRTFIFPFFSKYTIKHATYSLEKLIENYLKECCEKTIFFLNPYRIGLYTGPDDLAKILEYRLEWHMKSFILKVAMFTEDSVDWFSSSYHEQIIKERGLPFKFECKANDEKQTIDLLLTDTKFMNSLKEVQRELNNGYSRFRK